MGSNGDLQKVLSLPDATSVAEPRGFYAGSRLRQWTWSGVLAGAYVALVVGALVPVVQAPRLAWLLLPIALLLCPLGSLALTPLYRLLGRYRYYSPMLFVIDKPGEMHLHIGTLFDYVLQLNWSDRGCCAARKVMLGFLDGLIAIGRQVQAGSIPAAVVLVGTSYVFGERTVRRLCFALQRPSRTVLAMMALNSLTIALCYSFVRGRPALPELWRARRAEITAGALAAQMPSMLRLRRQLTAEVGTDALCGPPDDTMRRSESHFS